MYNFCLFVPLRAIIDLSKGETKRRWTCFSASVLTPNKLISDTRDLSFLFFLPSNKHLNMNLEQCTRGCCVYSLSSWPIALRAPSLSHLVSSPTSCGHCE